MKITNIEQVEHIYFEGKTYEIFSPETWKVYYSSGRERQFKNYDELPETVKAFLKTHYDIPVQRAKITKYIYKACNIIE